MNDLAFRVLFPLKTRKMSTKEIVNYYTPIFGTDDPLKGSSYVFRCGPFPQLETPEKDTFLIAPAFYMLSKDGGYWDEYSDHFSCGVLVPDLKLKRVMPAMYQCTTVDRVKVKHKLLDFGLQTFEGKFEDGLG